MKKIIFTILIVLILATGVDAGSVQLISYYPAPKIAYDRIRFIPINTLAAEGSPCNGAAGTLYLNRADNLIYYCRESNALGNPEVWGKLEGPWTQTGNNISLTDITNPTLKRVGIGIGQYNSSTNFPNFKLTLKNDGGILAKGTIDTGTILASSGNKFMWYPRKAAIRAGIHNEAEGNIGRYTVSFGYLNSAVAEGSAVMGGWMNQTPLATGTGDLAFVGGGYTNRSSHIGSSILAGYLNISYPPYSFVGGGQQNQATSSSAAYGWMTIVSGYLNNVFSSYGTIGGGEHNNISNGPSAATIGGGWHNTIPTANSQRCTISGGQYNTCSAQSATVGGGDHNTASAQYATVVGGQKNMATGDYATIIGGGTDVAAAATGNAASGAYSAIAGGKQNTASGAGSTIGGGVSNNAAGAQSFIGGGQANSAMGAGQQQTVVGGMNNSAQGLYSFIGGGSNNTVTGNYSAVSGGYNNTVSGDFSWAGGRNWNVTGDRAFAWGSNNSVVTVSQDDVFIIHSDAVGGIKTGFGTTAPTERLHINGNMQIENGALTLTNAPTIAAGTSLEHESVTYTIGYDLAEIYETSEEVEVGDLLTIDDTQKGKLKKSSSTYDHKLIGVASGSPAVLFEGHQMQLSPQPLSFKKGNKPPVALAGRIPVKVSLENGPISVGDILTSSSIPGHAMKATDREKSSGAVIGKALEPFTGGPHGETLGLITVYVYPH